jgi:deazaflavin-dependent oxidoreductase (nitroreductase family)
MRGRIWLSVLAVLALLIGVVAVALVDDMTDLFSAGESASPADPGSVRDRLAQIADRSVVRLTHYGRTTGTPYEVTTWFAVDGDTVYLPTSDRGRQWPRNVLQKPQIKLQIGPHAFAGTVSPITDDAQKHRVYELLRDKYWTIWLIAQAAPLLGRDPDNEEMDLGRGGFFRVAIDPS